MFDKSGPYRHTSEVNVTLKLSGEAPIFASVFLKHSERLIDLLNDSRLFIPIRGADGETMIIAKSAIASIIETHSGEQDEKDEDVGGDEARRRTSFDPYKVLRVDASASDEEIKRAWKERIKAVHPDAIAALDLDDELRRAAVIATQKVNYAYKQIMRERAEPLKGASDGA